MIYRIIDDDRYEFVHSATQADHRILRALDGTPRADNWQPARVRRVLVDDARSPLLPADLLWLGGRKIVMRRRAVDALRDMLESGGQILPLATDDGVELFALNVTRVLDALDEERSDIKRFDDTRAIMYITTPAFYESVVRDVPFFKLPFCGSEIYIGEPFKKRVEDAGLVGLAFEPAWSPGSPRSGHECR